MRRNEIIPDRIMPQCTSTYGTHRCGILRRTFLFSGRKSGYEEYDSIQIIVTTRNIFSFVLLLNNYAGGLAQNCTQMNKMRM